MTYTDDGCPYCGGYMDSRGGGFYRYMECRICHKKVDVEGTDYPEWFKAWKKNKKKRKKAVAIRDAEKFNEKRTSFLGIKIKASTKVPKGQILVSSTPRGTNPFYEAYKNKLKGYEFDKVIIDESDAVGVALKDDIDPSIIADIYDSRGTRVYCGTGSVMLIDEASEWREEYEGEFVEPTVKDMTIQDASIEELLFAVRQKSKGK